MSVTNSPNMSLPVPTVGQESGPDYAFDLNDSLTLIDQHDHSLGKGIQITPSGMNINANLPFNNNSATNLAALTLVTQTAIPTLQSVYVKAAGTSPVINELFYKDSAGQQVQLTTNGVVNATIASLVGWSYAAGTWTATQAADALPTTPASISAGNVILKPLAASTPYSTTLKPNAALSSNNQIVMPVLPASISFMAIDNSGNITAPYTLPSVPIATSLLALTPGSAITTRTLPTPAVESFVTLNSSGTFAARRPYAVGYVESASSGTFATGSTSFTPVTNLSVTITTTGRPVMVILQGDGTSGLIGANSHLGIQGNGGPPATMSIWFSGGVRQPTYDFKSFAATIVAETPGSIMFLDTAVAGTYTYVVQVRIEPGTTASAFVYNMILMAYEL